MKRREGDRPAGVSHETARLDRELRALAERYGLSDAPVQQLHRLVELVATDPAAPTTLTAPESVVRDHVADSLVALELDWVRWASVVADLGAGAGFPGLPLAIALPDAQVNLIESNGRKCEFIAATATACGIVNAQAVPARAEEWRAGLGACDLVTARALAPLAVVAEYAAPLLRVGGRVLAWRGRRDASAEEQAARAAAQLGLEVEEPLAVQPYPGALHRHLHPLVKASPTPDRFPRRAGMARKRPLG